MDSCLPRLGVDHSEASIEETASETTDSRALIKSFVKDIEVKPGGQRSTTPPKPSESPIGGGDTAERALRDAVRSTVQYSLVGLF